MNIFTGKGEGEYLEDVMFKNHLTSTNVPLESKCPLLWVGLVSAMVVWMLVLM